jgi:trimethylamine:corrinoid methyltransferase-like protein
MTRWRQRSNRGRCRDAGTGQNRHLADHRTRFEFNQRLIVEAENLDRSAQDYEYLCCRITSSDKHLVRAKASGLNPDIGSAE